MSWRATELELCESLGELLEVSLGMMHELKEQGFSIHHVAGPISADGDQHIHRNIAELSRRRDNLALELGSRAIVITSPLIFTEAVYTQLDIFAMPREKREATLRQFWSNLISAGQLDSIHFAPGFERSPGSMAEHQAAKDHAVPIKYLTDI